MGTRCQVTVASTSGINTSAASTALASFQSRELQPGEGAFAMQLDAVSASTSKTRVYQAVDRASSNACLLRGNGRCHCMQLLGCAVRHHVASIWLHALTTVFSNVYDTT